MNYFLSLNQTRRKSVHCNNNNNNNRSVAAFLIKFFILFSFCISLSHSEEDKPIEWQRRSCSSLLLGQFKCDEPKIDERTQSEFNCTQNHTVLVACYPAENVYCDGRLFEGRTIGFYLEKPCRYVTKYHYQTAVLLSIFTGMFGVDRFYLGYYTIGIAKLCTFGLMFIGYLVDLILIITQYLEPADGSKYIVDYYGQVIYPSHVYNNYTFNVTSY
jgi:TM2 domain-containing membrane protein YozV